MQEVFHLQDANF